jgi:hypothetical protein
MPAGLKFDVQSFAGRSCSECVGKCVLKFVNWNYIAN